MDILIALFLMYGGLLCFGRWSDIREKRKEQLNKSKMEDIVISLENRNGIIIGSIKIGDKFIVPDKLMLPKDLNSLEQTICYDVIDMLSRHTGKRI
jgi:hypothetical protein